MSNFLRNKHRVIKPTVFSSSQTDASRLPDQVSDFMLSVDTRFNDLRIYLDGLTFDDLRFLQPEDIISLVPASQHGHKLLMTVLARRYLYRDNNSSEGVVDPVNNTINEENIFPSDRVEKNKNHKNHKKHERHENHKKHEKHENHKNHKKHENHKNHEKHENHKKHENHEKHENHKDCDTSDKIVHKCVDLDSIISSDSTSTCSCGYKIAHD